MRPLGLFSLEETEGKLIEVYNFFSRGRGQASIGDQGQDPREQLELSGQF